MSLAASQALITNPDLTGRVTAAIRQTAAQRTAWEGPAGVLARAALTRPDTVIGHFMLRMSTNAEVAQAACAACGDARTVTDDTIEWIVGDAWEAIAQTIFQSAGEETASA